MTISNFKITTVKDVPADVFISSFAQYLKNEGKLQVPKWADIVKTSIGNELPPTDVDWFYTRTAAVARRIYTRPCSGTGGLRRAFGTCQRRGPKPCIFALSSGSVIRHALKELDRLGYTSISDMGGRSITSKGRQGMDYVAVNLAASRLQPRVVETVTA